MSKIKKYTLSGIFLAAIILACVAGYRYHLKNKANVQERFSLYIYPETTFEELIDTLGSRLTDLPSFVKCMESESPQKRIKPGYYRFDKGTKNITIVRSIVNGWQTPYRLTLSGNIRGVERLAGLLGRKMMHDSLSFVKYFTDTAVCERYGFDGNNFMGMFIPNTYEIYWTNSPEQFTERMRSEYERFWNNGRREKAKELGMTPQEVSILASIVCEESNWKPELPTIAGVYINRLKRGMKLEADPTVKFALKDPTIKRILYKHLRVDSPYNTYRNYGLPPGPITIPSMAGIDAVLDYKRHNYLYFCAHEELNGTHKFASTLREHNKNARAYQAAISKRRQ